MVTIIAELTQVMQWLSLENVPRAGVGRNELKVLVSIITSV